jgi:thioredoxin-disulfide reductase
MEKRQLYDLVIIGAGPAGLAASIYASRYGLNHIVIGSILGGQIAETHLIDNYPGIENVSGLEFSKKWESHVRKYGAVIIPSLVKSIEKTNFFDLRLENGRNFYAKTLLLATGTKRRKLNIIGEEKFSGRGVSYCATCDGFFYKNKIVGIIGGADSAAGAALYLASLCRKVYILYRGQALRAEPYWVAEIKKNPAIETLFGIEVTKIIGQDKLEKVRLSRNFKGKKELALDGLFIEAGSIPDIFYASNLGIKTDAKGYIKIKKNGATSSPGIWAAGDITDGSDKFCQVITAAAEGAIAVRSLFNWLKNKK